MCFMRRTQRRLALRSTTASRMIRIRLPRFARVDIISHIVAIIFQRRKIRLHQIRRPLEIIKPSQFIRNGEDFLQEREKSERSCSPIERVRSPWTPQVSPSLVRGERLRAATDAHVLRPARCRPTASPGGQRQARTSRRSSRAASPLRRATKAEATRTARARLLADGAQHTR